MQGAGSIKISLAGQGSGKSMTLPLLVGLANFSILLHADPPRPALIAHSAANHPVFSVTYRYLNVIQTYPSQTRL